MGELTKIEQIEQFDVENIVCFSGPRPAKLPDGDDDSAKSIIKIKRRLKQEIQNCLNIGKFIFINGAMAGFDILAGETILNLRQYHSNIVCVTIAPFRVDYFTDKKVNWTPEWKQRALEVYTQSDIAFSLSERYHKGVYYERDRFLVDHSSLLVCYYAGSGGGTKYTMEYAKQSKVSILNIFMEE